MSGSENRAIKEVFASYGYTDLEIVAVEELGDNIEGLDGEYKLVLIKKSSLGRGYAFGAVNTKDKTFHDFEFKYNPLNIIMLEVFNSDEQMIDNLKTKYSID